jgi:hypothetical protein
MTVTLRASWVGAAALTVLSSAGVAALSLAAAPATAADPEARVVAAYQYAPQPVTLSFPAPAAPAPPPAPVAPASVVVQQAAPAAPAPAARRVDPRCEGDGWQQRRGEAALERLRRPADARAVPVAFRPARSDVLGLADLEAARVEVFVRSCARQPDALLLHVLAHELGHVLDATRMTDALRAQWMEARGIPAGTPWFGCNACTDFATPAGDFAETYAQWQRGSRSSRSELAPAPSTAQLEELAARFF